MMFAKVEEKPPQCLGDPQNREECDTCKFRDECELERSRREKKEALTALRTSTQKLRIVNIANAEGENS